MDPVLIDDKVNTVVLPGDIVGTISDLKLRLGPGRLQSLNNQQLIVLGLLQNKENIVATKSGILRYSFVAIVEL